MKTNGNFPAHPMMPSHTNPDNVTSEYRGLTKREYFAGQALVGFSIQMEYTDVGAVAATCVRFADALIRALNDTTKGEG